VLRGRLVNLRTRVPADVPVLHEQLHDDVEIHMLAAASPWRPVAADAENGPFAIRPDDDDVAPFSVVEVATGELAGSALLWGIDRHNRNAHLGLSLLPAARGRGLGCDVVRVLCEYGFAVLGLHRLQLETSGHNEAMQNAARKAGFVQEGIQREAGWTAGRFADEVLFGLLAREWTPTR
jgi:RimJ/RimL family protein N-acetyltransferase